LVTEPQSLNLAAIWKLPVIFLCENNGYAMFTPQSQTTPVADIAQRASAYNIPGVVVDGQDVVAVYEAVSHAVARARSGAGPTLVETKTYRYEEHSDYPGMPQLMYRSDAEKAYWRARDPIELFRERLRGTREVSEGEMASIHQEVVADVEASVSFAKASPAQQPGALFEHFMD
jgi:acetoin:2,6-dichlorophenolindophenol oxidoreductase subunit alpha